MACWLSHFFISGCCALHGRGQAAKSAAEAGVAVGVQYDSTHVYVAPGEVDAFVSLRAGTSQKYLVWVLDESVSATRQMLRGRGPKEILLLRPRHQADI
jgi:hypothetical protein